MRIKCLAVSAAIAVSAGIGIGRAEPVAPSGSVCPDGHWSPTGLCEVPSTASFAAAIATAASGQMQIENSSSVPPKMMSAAWAKMGGAGLDNALSYPQDTPLCYSETPVNGAHWIPCGLVTWANGNVEAPGSERPPWIHDVLAKQCTDFYCGSTGGPTGTPNPMTGTPIIAWPDVALSCDPNQPDCGPPPDWGATMMAQIGKRWRNQEPMPATNRCGEPMAVARAHELMATVMASAGLDVVAANVLPWEGPVGIVAATHVCDWDGCPKGKSWAAAMHQGPSPEDPLCVAMPELCGFPLNPRAAADYIDPTPTAPDLNAIVAATGMDLSPLKVCERIDCIPADPTPEPEIQGAASSWYPPPPGCTCPEGWQCPPYPCP